MPDNLTEKMRELQLKFTTDDLGQYGIIPDFKAQEFIDLMVTQSTLLKSVRRDTVDRPAGEYYYFDLPSGVIKTAQAEGAVHPGAGEPFDTGDFVIDKAYSYACKKIKTALRMTWETINWALTGPEFENFLVSKWQQKLAENLEVLAIQGDTALVNDQIRGIDDGWIKQITTANVHIIDYSGAALDHRVWQQMRLALLRDPVARLLNKNLYWFCTPTVLAAYQHYLSDRGDPLGAAALMGAAEIRPDGIPFFNAPNCVPLIPETTSGGDVLTSILLGDPQQFLMLLHREFRLVREYVPTMDLWQWIGYAYVDFVVPFPRAFVLAKNVKVIGES